MKKSLFLRLLCGVLCLTMAMSMASCLFGGDAEDTAETTQDSQTEESTLPPVTDVEISFPKSGMDRFKVVYADGSGEDVIESANTLAKLIGTVCGYEPIVTNDFLRALTLLCKWIFLCLYYTNSLSLFILLLQKILI